MIIDTSALIALFDASDQAHERVVEVIAHRDEALVVSPYVVAELDYLIGQRHGVRAELAVLHELSSGAFTLAPFGAEALERAAGVLERYADRDVGVTDASIVVLAAQHRTRTIATLDHRHFDVLRPLTGGRFRVVP